MAQRQQPCDHIGCAVSACPCNDSTRHNRPAMIQRRYRMPSAQHIPTLEGSRVSITMLYSDGAEGARLRIVIVSVDNAVEVADVLPLELAELGWFLLVEVALVLTVVMPETTWIARANLRILRI